MLDAFLTHDFMPKKSHKGNEIGDSVDGKLRTGQSQPRDQVNGQGNGWRGQEEGAQGSLL